MHHSLRYISYTGLKLLQAMVAGRGSHPCILQWTAFNEVSQAPSLGHRHGHAD
eukprot:COSAG02_NODE_916_length_15971_cov_12.781061_19_plen_53_part_01